MASVLQRYTCWLSWGANVVLADINEVAGTKVVDDLIGKGKCAIFVRTDVAESADVKDLIQAAVGYFGSLEILMHFAGLGIER